MLKSVLIVVFALLVLFFGSFWVMAWNSRSEKAAGLVDQKLAPCPDSPNCVCSEDPSDEKHYIEPLSYGEESSESIFMKVEKAIKETGGKIVSQEKRYLAAEYYSTIFGFVDDLEVRLDDQNRRVHFRSASRSGYSDMGVNRKRVEKLKELIGKK